MNCYPIFQKSQLIGLGILALLLLLLLLAIQESWLTPAVVQRPAIEEAISNRADLALAPDGPAAAGVEYLEEGPRADAGNVLVWDAETGGVVNRYNVGGTTFGTRWSPDGTRVLTTGFFDAPDIRPVWQSTEELID